MLIGFDLMVLVRAKLVSAPVTAAGMLSRRENEGTRAFHLSEFELDDVAYGIWLFAP